MITHSSMNVNIFINSIRQFRNAIRLEVVAAADNGTQKKITTASLARTLFVGPGLRAALSIDKVKNRFALHG